MTTQDDEQAREDWEWLTPRQRESILLATDVALRDGWVGYVHTTNALARRKLMTIFRDVTARGQRCAAYGRKVTGG